jgi:serine/threonine protein kinase
MLEICTDKDAALIELAQQRGLLSAERAERVRRERGTRSAAVALVEDGHLCAPAVRALRTELQRRSVNHAFDGYELIGKLGAGGMSVVFKATDLVSRRLVAIKVVSPHVTGDPLFLERFYREARSAAAVVHPHVIACHGLGETKGKAYMVLEYMAGGDVEALAARSGGRLAEQRALQIAVECASGLEAIHAHGLVHRDIKPSNIFLDDAGRAKLADLGLAKSMSPDDQLTMPGKRVGSPGYMAPEQSSGSSGTDIRSDIYSLGATMYHLLSGRAAFIGHTPLEIILKSLREEPAPLQEVAPWVSPRISAIVARCMARKPEDRYQHPAELREIFANASAPAPLPGSSATVTAARRPALSLRLHSCLATVVRGLTRLVRPRGAHG